MAADGPSEVADCGMGQTVRQLADPLAPHSCIDKPGGMEGGGKQTSQPRAPAWGNKASKPLIKNTHGG